MTAFSAAGSRRLPLGIDLSQQGVPDASTLMGFRHRPEANNLAQAMLVEVNAMLIERGLMMSKGTLVDATLIAAPSSTKNYIRNGRYNAKNAGNRLERGAKYENAVARTEPSRKIGVTPKKCALRRRTIRNLICSALA